MNSFSKTHTQIAKGIAILMMLYHHLYVVPERIDNNFFSLIDQFIPNAQITIAVFCKLCVCIYVFLSGFGLYHSLKNKKSLLDMYKNIGVRLINFLITFIVIYLLFVTVGMINNTFSTDWKHFLLGLFTLELGYFNNTWWFVNAYIVLLIISPLFVYLFCNKHWIKKIIVICILPTIYLLGKVFISIFGENLITIIYFKYFEDFPLILTLLIGVICAKYNIYEKILSIFDNIKNKRTKIIVRTTTMVIALILSIFLRIITTTEALDIYYDFIIAPVFVFSITTILYDIKLNKIFILFGNHSTVMWLTHAFLCYTYAKSLVCMPYYSELIYLWFIFLSLLTSYLVNLILVPLNNFIQKKPHKLSYKGYFTFIKLQKHSNNV